MKWFVTLALLLGVTAAGCMPLRPDDKNKVPQTQMKPQGPPPVMPDEVTETNAKEIEKRLQAEIEYETKGAK